MISNSFARIRIVVRFNSALKSRPQGSAASIISLSDGDFLTRKNRRLDLGFGEHRNG